MNTYPLMCPCHHEMEEFDPDDCVMLAAILLRIAELSRGDSEERAMADNAGEMCLRDMIDVLEDL